MPSTPVSKTLEKIANDCILCGCCLNDCALLSDLGMTPAEIAQAVLDDQVDDRLLAAIQRCDLCGNCSAGCLVNLSPAEMFRAAREVLMQKGVMTPDDYDVMLTDRAWNFFSIYRATYGIDYSDLERDEFEVLFFPGCTLSSYAPELTRAALAWLQQGGETVGLSSLCCGKPLDSIGLSGDASNYLLRLRQFLDRAGSKRIVTACSNCQAHLKAHLPDMEIQSIYALMRQEGIRLEGAETLTFHDSCPDRDNPHTPADIRALLGGYPQVEMTSHGQNTICCGSGGIVSMIDPELCAERAERRLAEFAASGADVCITSCMACAHRLARRGGSRQVRHCLEAVFGIEVDYEQVAAKTRGMWEGSQGELNLQRLSTQTLDQDENQ